MPVFMCTAHAQTSPKNGYIGVNIQNITEDLVKLFNLKTDKGVVATYVFKGSPADKAGIRKGDVITAFDGREFQNSRGLASIVAATPIGKEVPVRVLVGERETTLILKVGTLEPRKSPTE
jgi:serine protease Do